nr:bacteriohopanetetrol glucosamine biosynthesis glycosyltransferase HpnI [Paraburkholderia phosphatilytica]
MPPGALAAPGFWQWLLIALCCVASLYAVVAAAAMGASVWRRAAGRRTAAVKGRAARHAHDGISVLKPLCGDEPRLYENLATFCEQQHARYQLLFGVSSPADPAIAVVRRLQAAYPALDIEVVVDSRVYGSNLKVSNLINLAQRARHDLIVLADSDIAVTPDYLDHVTAPLADAHVGVVTCLYRARPLGSGWRLWPRLGAMFIDSWFAPSVRIAHAFGSREFGFGATLALRRTTLDRIGGFMALKDCLADDFCLAEFARDIGLATVLVPLMVKTDVVEASATSLWLRETRWLRTIRSVNPAGFAGLFITFTSPWLAVAALACAKLAASGMPPPGSARGIAFATLAASTLAGIVARIVVHAASVTDARTFWRDLLLVPVRDVLLALEWLGAAFGSTVVWRGARMAVANPGAAAAGAAAVGAGVGASLTAPVRAAAVGSAGGPGGAAAGKMPRRSGAATSGASAGARAAGGTGPARMAESDRMRASGLEVSDGR